LAETPLASDLTGATLLSDSELVLRARQGDRRSFGTLYLRHHDAAWRVACAAAGSPTDAEDAVAEGFAKVFAALPRMVDRELAFRPYLLACVRNAAVDRHRRTRKLDLRDEVPEQAAVAGDPDEIVLADLERNLVGEALRSLPERWRTVLWLTEVEGMTPTEVSSVIGIKPNAVAALSYRAREGLREAYLQAHVRAEARADCRYTVDRLSSYVRNELAARERDKVQTHLDGCANCRQRRDELADVNASLLGALVPVPLLLGSRTQQEWLSVAHLGKGTRRAKAPAKAAKAASLGTSPAAQRTLAMVVALLLAISGAVSLERFGPGGKVGKTYDPVAIPKHPAPATPPAVSAPTEEALPAPVTPAPTPSRRAAKAPVEIAAPVLAPVTPAPAQAASPAPEPAPAPGPAPEPAPEPAPPPAPPPEQPPPPPPPAPTPPPAAAGKASVGEGENGAVFALAVPNNPAENPQPDVDVTVGSTPLVGDAPPSEGTGVDVSVSPTTALHRIFRASERHAVLEGLERGRVRVGSVPPRPASETMAEQATASGCGAIAYSFHTAAARAAACPELQFELESSGSALFWGLAFAPPAGD
jgi:RNA polymerase sigma factor (sigma-70 family)